MNSYNEFLKEILHSFPKLKIGMKFETLRSFFPDNNVPRDIRNINEEFTIPLALSSKDKVKIRKRDKNVLLDFLDFKKTKKEKGDILIIKEVHGNYALCENISRPKSISEKYYLNEKLKFVKITLRDLLEGNIKEIKRLRRK